MWTSPRNASILVGASGALVGTKANAAAGTMVKHKTLQTIPKVLRCVSNRKTVWLVRDTRECCGTGKSEIFRGDRKTGISTALSTIAKGALAPHTRRTLELSAGAYYLSLRTVATLDHLAEVHETFEDAWTSRYRSPQQATCFLASEDDDADKMGAAQRQQDGAWKHRNMDGACRESSNCLLSMRHRGSL